jgi:hypothetical protein
VPEFNYTNGPSQVIQCAVKSDNNSIDKFTVDNKVDYIDAYTKEIDVEPNDTVEIWRMATQYRRTNDNIYGTFTRSAKNPQIEVIIPDEFEQKVEFGTEGRVEKTKYSNRYTLHGVYFPGQYMMVRWWPKKAAATTRD